MSNLRNDTGTKFRKYPIHEMDQAYLVMDSWNSSYEMYQSWIVGFRKCPIYEMAKTQIWISKKISNLWNGPSLLNYGFLK